MAEQGQNGVGDSGEPNGDDVPVVRLLDDKPSDNDATGGGHKRVAEAIARLIERERGGKAIALEGSWGSGKSSVVRMLGVAFTEFAEEAKKSNKKKDPKPQDRTNHDEQLPTDYLVYTFDAWKHEGDPLRVAFLRGLVDELHGKGWLDEAQHDDWKLTFDELTSAIRTERTNRRARLRPQDILAITCLLAAVPAIPLWVRLQGAFTAWSSAWVLANSLLLVALLPVAIGLLEYLRVRIFGMPREETEKPRGYFKTLVWKAKHKQGVVELLLTRQPREHTTTFAEPPTVTTELFERKYAELMQEVLNDWPERRLILVIDNLDRLDCDDALAIWSTMRTFLEMRPAKTEWAGWMWVLVPYDREQMGRLWDGKANVAEGEPAPLHDRPSSFLDKTFAVRFDVPPLLLANWEKALGCYLREALGKALSDEEIEGIVRLSRKYASSRRHPPTPRHLKLFVNDIGALVRQYGDEFPLESLAAYAILRRGGMGPEGVREALRVNRAKLAEHIPGDWPTKDRLADLACLVFTTTNREAARELLLTGPVTQTIRDGDVEQLEKLLKGPGAVSVIGEWLPTVGDNLKDVPVPSVQACLQLIVELRSEADGPDGCSKSRWVALLDVLAERLVGSCENWHKADDLPSLCREVLAAWPGSKSCEQVAGRLYTFNLEEASGTDPEHLAEAWCILWTEGREDGEHACQTRPIPIPAKAPACVLFLNHLWTQRDASRGLWSSLSEITKDSVIGMLLPDGATKNWPESVFGALNVLWGGGCKFINWATVAQRIEEYLDACAGDERDTLLSILTLFRGDNLRRVRAADGFRDGLIPDSNPFKALRKKTIESGQWHMVYTKATASSNWELAAAAVAEIGALQALTDVGANTAEIQTAKPELDKIRRQPANQPKLVKAMAELPLPAIRGFLQSRVAGTGAAALVLAVLDEMEMDAIRQCVPVAWVLEHWSQIAKLESETEGIATRVMEAHETAVSGDSHALSKAVADKDVPTELTALCRALIERGSTQPSLIASVQKHMKELPSGQWVTQITEWADWAGMLIALEDEHVPRLGRAYYKALLMVAKLLANKPEAFGETPMVDDEPKRYIQALEPDYRPQFYQKLRQIAASQESDVPTELEMQFGPFIAEAMYAEPHETDLDDFVNPALLSDEKERPAWLGGFLAHDRSRAVIEAAPKRDRDVCLANIRELADSEDEFGAMCARLAERCTDLMPPEEPQAPDDDPPA